MDMDDILRRVATTPEFLQQNTDTLRAIVQSALKRASEATCPYKKSGLQCQLPKGHDGEFHQRLILWEDDESDEFGT